MKMVRAAFLTVAALPPLMACAPLSVEQAERLCVERANEARRPRGQIDLGLGSNGRPVAALDVTISTDLLFGRDPAQVFDECVKSRSGQFPAHALDDQPDWVG